MQLKKLFNCIGILYIFNCSCSRTGNGMRTICARICCIFNWNTVSTAWQHFAHVLGVPGQPFGTSAPQMQLHPLAFLMLMNGRHQMVSVSWLLTLPKAKKNSTLVHSQEMRKLHLMAYFKKVRKCQNILKFCSKK